MHCSKDGPIRHLVGSAEYREWGGEAEGLGSL